MEGSNAQMRRYPTNFVDWGDGNSEYITIPEEDRGDYTSMNFGHVTVVNQTVMNIQSRIQFSDSYDVS